ncbi:MAG: HAMP domain-containing histidine kinase [Cytophagales bacterium]|nr:HAMP domain-containing histidine kinase [Cytophagales bacterium]
MLEISKEGVIISSNDQVSFVNQAFCDLFELPLTAQSLIGWDGYETLMLHQSIIKGFDAFSSKIWTQMEDKAVQTGQIIELKSGTCLSMEYYPIFEEGRAVGDMWRYKDVTEELREKQQIGEENQVLAQQNMIKNTLLAVLAHDLRSPMDTLEATLSVCQSLSLAEIKSFSHEIKKTVGVTRTLMDNLLYWVQTQTHGIHIEKRPLLLSAVVDETFELLRATAVHKGNRFINQVPEGFFVNADQNVLKTVIRNLVSNANKFTTEGDVEVKVVNAKNFVEIRVTDTGVGMSREVLEKLFRPERHYTSLGTYNEKGTGLGLLLCKEMIEKHGGRIWVRSQQNRGSVFCVGLPKL